MKNPLWHNNHKGFFSLIFKAQIQLSLDSILLLIDLSLINYSLLLI